MAIQLTEQRNVRLSKVIDKALAQLAKDNATNIGIEIRKAIVERLKKKGKLNKEQDYL